MRRQLTTVTLAALAIAMSAPSAMAASTFSAAAEPAAAGTSDQPKALDATLEVNIDSDATGTPKAPADKLEFALPGEFAGQLDKFAVCDREAVHKASDINRDNRRISQFEQICPKDSKLGEGVIRSVIPELRIDATSDEMLAINTGGNTITFWFEMNKPARFNTYIDATVTQGSAPFGPTVTLDLTRLVDRTFSVEARVKRFQVSFLRAGTTQAPAGGAGGTDTTGRKKKQSCTAKANGLDSAKRRRAALNRCARSTCRRKARKVKSRQRREAALRKCSRIGRKKSRRAGARASQAPAEKSPFASTGCSGGTWPLQARIHYYKEAAAGETIDASVACSGAASAPPPPPPPPACPLPVCVIEPPSRNR